MSSRLTKKAEPPPTRGVNRDSGTDSANGGWIRRLVRPLVTIYKHKIMQIELEKQTIHADSVTINHKPRDYSGQFWNGFFWALGASCAAFVVCVIIGILKLTHG